MTLLSIQHSPAPPPTGLRGLCQCCGKGQMFQGYLVFKPACETCGQDFTSFGSTDGLAFLVMSIAGTLVVAIALWMEFTHEPPIWMHTLVAGTMLVGLSVLLVRPVKNMLAALQLLHRAEQRRLEK